MIQPQSSNCSSCCACPPGVTADLVLSLDSNTEGMAILAAAATAKPIPMNSKVDDMTNKPEIHMHNSLRAPITPDRRLHNNRMEGDSNLSRGDMIIDMGKDNRQASPAEVLTVVKVKVVDMVCLKAVRVTSQILMSLSRR